MVTLAEENAKFLAESAPTQSEEMKRVYNAAADYLAEQGVLDRALGVGDKAPMFELPDADGKTVKLADIMATGPVLVTFYRGAWCPYCNLELRAMQRELETAEAANVRLVAISPNTPDVSRDLVAEAALTFPVLSDAENAVAKQFNLVFEMDPGLVEFYKAKGRNVNQMNGSDRWELPVPATYVIDTTGTIQYANVDLNHRVRAEPSEVIAVAAGL